ncbi:glycosyltransferase [Fusobacterium sp.]|uniref:glycosyltransferase n=1 Tax=Fusobacterium sp. TaxID=68766 RepID=UPI0029043AC0|nr:glycosyltransferase [Fusobacterium sp.]MDU1909898.1 glycosyltransferase [Fusobacterium sp.]
MKKLLYISTFLPSKKSKFPSAGSNTTLSNIKNLHKSGYKIDFCSLVNLKEYKDKIFYENECIENLILFKISILNKIVNLIWNFQLPILCSVRYDRRLKKFLKENSQNYVSIIFDFTQNINYLKDIKGVKKILIEHDISFQAFERKMNNEKNYLRELFYKFEYKRLKKYEETMLGKFDLVIVQNDKDYKLIEGKNRNIKILKPFFNKFLIEPRKRNKEINIGFFGAMNREENEEAVIFFLNKIWKKIQKKNIYFYIIGANPSEKLKKIVSNYSNVILTGFIEKVEEYFSILDIGVIPLLKGAGIKIKTVEMLYSGIPVVSTEVGIEGIIVKNGQDYLLANSIEEFVNKIKMLIEDKELYKIIKDNLIVKRERLILGKEISDLINL